MHYQLCILKPFFTTISKYNFLTVKCIYFSHPMINDTYYVKQENGYNITLEIKNIKVEIKSKQKKNIKKRESN